MPDISFSSPLPVKAEKAFAWHERPGAFDRLVPPWAPVALQSFEGIQDGQRATIRMGAGPTRFNWIAEHRDYEAGVSFKDVQVKGPFKKWEHTHRMTPEGDDACLLTDHIEYELPAGRLGQTLDKVFLGQEIIRQFAYRHRVTATDLRIHQKYDGPALTIGLSGSNGLLGRALRAFLTTGGHTVVPIVRKRGAAGIYWNPDTGGIDANRFNGIDAVIHLAGEPVFSLRWTEAKKRRIYQSRVIGTHLISKALSQVNNPPKIFISASGTGIYGSRGDEVLTETSRHATDGFLSGVCKEWERAATLAADAGIRTVQMRLGPVFSAAGGSLPMLSKPFSMFVGGRVGQPDHYLPWVVLDDVLYAIRHILHHDDLSGPVNLTAPEPATLQETADTLSKVLDRPSWLHPPVGIIKSIMGEVADETIFQSARVVPRKLLDHGFVFQYPDLHHALGHVLGKKGFPEEASVSTPPSR